MKTTHTLLSIACSCLFVSCASTSNFILHNIRESKGFGGHLIEASDGAYKATYHRVRVWDDPTTPQVDTYKANQGWIFGPEFKGGYIFSVPTAPKLDDTKLVITDANQNTTGEYILDGNSIVLIMEAGSKPVYLKREWHPKKGATTQSILNYYRDLIERENKQN